jgi:hypothetical protein
MQFISDLQTNLDAQPTQGAKIQIVHAFLQSSEHQGACKSQLLAFLAQPTSQDVRYALLAIACSVYPAAFFGPPGEDDVTATEVIDCAKQAHVLLVRHPTNHTFRKQPFHHAFAAFVHTFKKWKTKDACTLFNALVRSYVNVVDTAGVVHLPDAEKMKTKLVQQATQLHIAEHVFRGQVSAVCASDVANCAVADITAQLQQLDTLLHQQDPSWPKPSVAADTHPPIRTIPPHSVAVDTIENTVHRAFWDAFVHRLNEGHTDQLQLLLEELSSKLKQLTPHKKDIQHQVHTAIDVQLLTQMVKHRCMDNAHFLRTTDFVVQHVVHMQAPVHTEQTTCWYARWKTTFLGSTEASAYASHLSHFLKQIHTDIDTILSVTSELRRRSNITPN